MENRKLSLRQKAEQSSLPFMHLENHGIAFLPDGGPLPHLVNVAARFGEMSVCELYLWVEEAAWVLWEPFHSHTFANGWVDCGTK
jgi:hypothetical protein